MQVNQLQFSSQLSQKNNVKSTQFVLRKLENKYAKTQIELQSKSKLIKQNPNNQQVQTVFTEDEVSNLRYEYYLLKQSQDLMHQQSQFHQKMKDKYQINDKKQTNFETKF
ncbi:hypothetical protein TTHERM_00261840 (macronuclear) [Tetrahymena thermophila SB210]|uniref:Uncharacterized protein n=1 Tax=Tetrahymena thermophila (strain SB210) TaxID=312017 RepID=Q22UA0_TETTS|nr:hypothetical protein TTHERM_00261840 [Tetrahymena thermophila SB210]EAR88787.2 hypothetical protein TTHERM_00261840 [Tetrahymena thermophila SB210]|eukprot:XP_001009032.2 hypothetical protein TTHERM_00261840 [Tetrahymena thermophila SB210]